jgi:hypothetical protein
MRIERSPRFKKAIRQLPPDLQGKAKKKIALFVENPRHPSLRFKRVEGYSEDPPIMEISVDMKTRITLQIYPDHYYFRHIGTHEIFRSP